MKQQRFGEFFREKRLGLGLKLREFCRRNGLDPGNVSRLEKSKSSPPQSEAALLPYAEALKLGRGSPDWQTFFELASLDSGKLPTHVAESPETREQLPGLLRSLRATNRQVRPWTSTVDLHQWSQFLDARKEFPRLLRRLIQATVKKLERIEFAAGEGSQRKGWDGTVVAEEGTAYVPSGVSVWELGVGANPSRKAEEDYSAKSKNPQGVEPSEATYIFVTPRRWEGKAAWEREKNKEGIWKKVRVYDADNLEAWLEEARAVDAWFASLIGKRPEGVQDIEEYWKNLSALTEPNLSPEVFLTSREEEIKSLTEWLSGPPSVLAIEARSPAESIDFVAAYLARLAESERAALSSRVLVVETKEQWEGLTSSQNSLMLIIKPGIPIDAESVAQAVRNGHYVLLTAENFASASTQKLELSRPLIYDVEKALVDSGLDEEQVRKSTKDCGGSLTVLKRRLSRYPGTTEPHWSREGTTHDLALLTLIGTWEEGSEGDRKIVEAISGRAYSDVAADLQNWSSFPDPPVLRMVGRWSFTSREDSWLLLGRYLTPADLERFEKLAIEVLSEEDPRLELPWEERQFSGIRGTSPRYSQAIRNGLAETLALLATLGAALKVPGNETDRAEHVVRQVLFGKKTWKRWASLRGPLPLLAEAAPEAFLGSLETDLRESEPAILQLFRDHDDPLLSTCLHAGLLWALETLAWNTAHLSRVTTVLAKLTEQAPHTKWGNTPGNSLVEIFLPWLPQTAANVAQRIEILRKLSQKQPVAAWKLLVALLPSMHGISHTTHRPAWREWAVSRPKSIPTGDYFEQVDACAALLLEIVGDDAERWASLIKRLADLPKPRRTQMIELLKSDSLQALSDERRKAIADATREQVGVHKRHADAEWSLPKEEVDELERSIERLQPTDLVTRENWLFQTWVRLPDWTENSYDENEKRVTAARQDALRRIFEKGGFEDILRLSETSDAWTVGFALADSPLPVNESAILPVLLDSASQARVYFAQGFASARSRRGEWDWIESLPLQEWSAKQVANLALVLSREARAWRLIEARGDETEKLYWESANLLGVRGHDDTAYATRMLIKYGRPFSAADLLAMELHSKGMPSTELILQVLQAGLQLSDSFIEKPTNMTGHAYRELFGHLQSGKVEVDESRLATLEWGYLSVLDGHGADPLTLHRLLTSDPQFFAHAIQLIFRSTKQSEDTSVEAPEERRQKARNAYQLLRSLESIPGYDSKTSDVDGAALMTWVKAVRQLCDESGHVEIGDSQIGQLLSHSPKERDGTWPCIAVRDVIDELNREEMVRGFAIGTMNKRGVVTKSPYEGGEQERSLAKTFSDNAAACEGEWPVTAQALRQVAQHYENYAKREDEEAEARRIGR